MSRIDDNPKRRAVQSGFLILGYLCVICCAAAGITRLGWIHPDIPGFYGFRALAGWLVAAVLCLFLACFLGRPKRG